MSILEVRSLKKSFGEVEVLNGVSFTVEKGDAIAVIGPSGSGNSTMLRCLIGLEQADGGYIIIDGVPLMDNLISAPVMVKKINKSAAVERAKELLHDVGLLDKQDVYPSALSGGQKQRVAIARALMMDPDLLLFDEPTSSLDPQLTAEVLAVMKKLVAKRMTMILVTHEMGFAREAADKVIFMGDKKILEMGPTEQIFEHPSDPRIKEFIQSIL